MNFHRLGIAVLPRSVFLAFFPSNLPATEGELRASARTLSPCCVLEVLRKEEEREESDPVGAVLAKLRTRWRSLRSCPGSNCAPVGADLARPGGTTRL